jgi:hypothetical protein
MSNFNGFLEYELSVLSALEPGQRDALGDERICEETLLSTPF